MRLDSYFSKWLSRIMRSSRNKVEAVAELVLPKMLIFRPLYGNLKILILKIFAKKEIKHCNSSLNNY